MPSWLYEKIYESGFYSGYSVQIADIELTRGNIVRVGGRCFLPDQEIDFEYGALRLQRDANSRSLLVYAPHELHVFEFRRIVLWSTCWYRYTPVSSDCHGEIDVSELPQLPWSVRFKEQCITGALAVGLIWGLVHELVGAWSKVP